MNKPQILIVEKEEKNFLQLKEILREQYAVSWTETVEKAVAFVEKSNISLVIISDLQSAEEAQILAPSCKGNSTDGQEIPMIALISARNAEKILDDEMKIVYDIVFQPVIPALLLNRIEKALQARAMHHDMEEIIKNQKQQIQRFSLQSMLTIAEMIDAKDRYAKGHSVRVALYAREIALHLGWNEKEIEDLYYTALLHDIGKIAVDESILNKAAELTPEEFEQVKRHTSVGSEMVRNAARIPKAEDAVRYHHEWYDGSGYVGVAGEKIPIAARIIAIADAYEAMTSDRAFRKHLEREEAKEELLKGRGTQFDPALVDIFLTLLDGGLSIEKESEELISGRISDVADPSDLLRQVYSETVQEAQSERERDSLTGFLNRRYFEEKINVALHPAKMSGTFFMMDLDEFKNVNDFYGHAKGDQMILAFADVIRKNTRDNDYVCRIGGDEFAVFFPEMTRERVIKERAEDIIRSFADKRKEMDCDVCSVSIGIMTRYPGQKNMNYSTLYDNADKALYYVKNNGKDSYHIYANEVQKERDSAAVVRKMDLEQLLRRIAERSYHQGAYSVEYDRLAYIYQFIARNIERSRQQVQLILFTMQEEEDNLPEEVLEDALMLLETAIVRSLRRGDVTSRLGVRQQLVILMDADVENAKMVTERILAKYRQVSGKSLFRVEYEITDVPVKR